VESLMQVAILAKSNDIIYFQLDTRISAKKLDEAVTAASTACHELFKKIIDRIEKTLGMLN
jgi:ribonuclease PH